ncbi:MAG: type I-B CRISPR-associated protein Cas7/Cst2/DevR [Anaerolineaceae bacterium]|nr:MAG: type I-B CRISPR-associated protein Cas7/Cst2/DevR [Anaerolineaceae bacterium]
MAFISGTLLIDAPASALNNSGEPIPNARTANTSSVKFIRGKDGTYPYVSGQAQRYWLRNTLEKASGIRWESSPTYRGDKIAFTDANPILYWDDDLLGYMRAPGKKDYENIKNTPELTQQEEDAKGNPRTVTRVSPFRIGTLVSIAPVNITEDFGTMTRTENDPVPYEHQFYRAYMHTLFALDLAMAGTFTYSRRSGFQNLDSVRKELAEEHGLTKRDDLLAYQLPPTDRADRVRSLLLGLGELQGGAKQAIHYTDVSPAIAIFAVVRGGSNPFNYLFAESGGQVSVKLDVLQDAIADLVKHDLLLSPVCIGWKPGFIDEQRPSGDFGVEGAQIYIDTPRSAFAALADYITQNPNLMDE